MTEPGTRRRLGQIYRAERRQNPAVAHSVLFQKAGDWVGVAALLAITVMGCVMGGWWIALGVAALAGAGLMVWAIRRRREQHLP
jgi:Flp pilus assembly protein TadB